ncbi:MAG TPA: PEP-CTERM sorting domain-containing protein, partial [Luteolibacter sp.]|nr:PEP-CTERM sorting domain-containing protein [Luteolibacter sp.]
TVPNRFAPTSVLEGGLATTNVTAGSITTSGYAAAIINASPAPGSQVAGSLYLATASGNPDEHLSTFFSDTTTANDSEAEVAALSQYFQLTISPAAGYSLDLSTLQVDYTASGNTNGRNFFVRYDYSGASTGFAGPSVVSAGPIATADAWLTAGSVGNLNSVPVINAGESVTLRFFSYRTGVSTVAQNFRFDDISITGELTAVPEPSAVMISGLCGLAGFVRRRRSL